MVPDVLLNPPITLGMFVIGPLLIGAVILGLIGLGAVWLSGGKKQDRRLQGFANNQQLSGGQNSRAGSAEERRLAKMSLEELRREAGSLLIAADNAVNSSEQEILFASAAYGDEQVAPFQKDVDEAREHLQESFRMQHTVDRDPPEDEEQARELLRKVIANCQRVNETLESHRQDFESLRSLELDPRPALDQLRTRIGEFRSRREQAAKRLPDLQSRYDDDALTSFTEALTHSARSLQHADTSADDAEKALTGSAASDAVVAIHAGEEAAGEAGKLIDSLEETQLRLRSAEQNLGIGLDQTEQDIAQARATMQAGQSAELAGPIAAAEAAVKQVRRALDSGEKTNPLELLNSLEIAHRELDEPLNAVRDQQARDRRAREVLQTEILTARHQVQSSRDYLRSKRSGATSRTRMAEAERTLAEAESIGDGQPAKALELATQAKTLAVQAAQIARQESAEDALSGGGGYGGGFGGFGMPGGYGYPGGRRPMGGGGFGRRRRMF
ncbi:hypothetical protein LTH96_01710 [Nesterenkonia sp. LB17]|uniref:hypothetical protein n=1 Tax=unclassified Nesterenkonia TaxID=2629769 RepID=UPI001F4CDC57|nr:MULTISPECIES: hypothetical protein [unclassified Nesterenkonia]MCH8559841.1 hypothetical protein [Nesterenkonia sp. DZ6]MCH8564458.1 hypothetical protein [Nesterenkonia sp. LB17]MCH8570084.1 hypothetical protein [Nesterenkonia sp. AY15]